jgi:hypothetical protein
MKDSKNNRQNGFEGAGYLTGAVVTILTGMALFIFTENVVIAISSAVPIGFTIGLLLEQKNRDGQEIAIKRSKPIMTGLVILGIIAFISVIFLV